MNYELEFREQAIKEWEKLPENIRSRFSDILEKRLITPRIPRHKLSGSSNRYKIKLQSLGYRLVYEVVDDRFVVVVIAVGERSKNQVYKAASSRK